MKKEMLIILALLFPVLGYAQTRVKADSIQKAYFDSTLNRAGQWEIVWSDVSKTPRILYGGKLKLDGTKTKDLEKMAMKFLKDHKGLFQIEEKDLKFKTLIKDDLEHIHFDQVYEDIRVVGGGYSLHVNENEEVICANGKIFDITPLDVSPSIDPSQAALSVKSYLGMNDSMEVLGAELVIYPRDSVFYLTYEMYVSAGNLSGSYRALVDAKTGTVIDAENTACRYTNGLANVYKIDPRTPYEQVTLNRLAGNGYLDGQFVKVIDWFDAEAYSEIHDFRYDPSDRRFDQANVYYHIDIFQNNFLTPLGFTPSGTPYTYKLDARVHTSDDGAGTTTSPVIKYLCTDGLFLATEAPISTSCPERMTSYTMNMRILYHTIIICRILIPVNLPPCPKVSPITSLRLLLDMAIWVNGC